MVVEWLLSNKWSGGGGLQALSRAFLPLPVDESMPPLQVNVVQQSNTLGHQTSCPLSVALSVVN